MAKAKQPVGFKYLLLHNCSRKGCEGSKGSEIIVSQADHEWFQAHVVPGRGAKLLSVVYAGGEEIEQATDEPVAELR